MHLSIVIMEKKAQNIRWIRRHIWVGVSKWRAERNKEQYSNYTHEMQTKMTTNFNSYYSHTANGQWYTYESFRQCCFLITLLLLFLSKNSAHHSKCGWHFSQIDKFVYNRLNRLHVLQHALSARSKQYSCDKQCNRFINFIIKIDENKTNDVQQ